MTLTRSALVLLIGFFAFSNSSKVSYNGDQVWRFVATSAEESSFAFSLLEKRGFDIWATRKEGFDFRVPKTELSQMKEEWKKRNWPVNIFIDDVGKAIEKERLDLESGHQNETTFHFDKYHTLEEIFDYLDQLSSESDLITLQDIGKTYEGRPIRLAKVTSQKKANSRPAVWIDCGIHAREWISPATCVWALNFLTSQYGANDVITDFIDNNELYILPVLNADGYHYTWTNDRLWRKNRITHSLNHCIGVDINRNYDDGHWNFIGASADPCSEVYAGPAPFSELESSAVRDKVNSIQDSQFVKAFFSIHSYSQLWLFPYGWTPQLPADSDELFRVSNIGVEASKAVNGTVYVNGPQFSTLYPAAGTAPDWSYSAGIVQSYVIELRDTGHYGFLLPADQILPTAQELWAGLIAAINAI